MPRDRKIVRDPISGSDMRAANYRALLVNISCQRFRKKEIPDGNDRV